MRITTSRLTAAALCASILSLGTAWGVPDDIPVKEAVETTDAVDWAAQNKLVIDGFEAEDGYRHRLAELRRLNELAIASGDRVRAEQLASMRAGVVRRHQARRDAIRELLIDDYRERFDKLLGLGAGAEGPKLRAMPSSAAPTAQRRTSSNGASGDRFANRRAAAQQRVVEVRSAARTRQDAARTRVQGTIDNARALQSYRAARPAGASDASTVRRPSSTTDTTRSQPASAEQAIPDSAPTIRLVRHGEAYARASTKITDRNASQIFWRLKKELAREADELAATPRSSRAAKAHAQDHGKGTR